jgi:hypothetical protein
MKTLEEFDFSKAPLVAPTRIDELVGGGYILERRSSSPLRVELIELASGRR